SKPAASHIHDASRHERSCDSSGCPNALSCASASVATNSARRSCGSKIGTTPDVRPAAPEQDRLIHGVRLPGHPGRRGRRRGGRIMADATGAPGKEPIRVGVIAEQTGPLSFMGLANANVARMVIGDLNARGGLLG